MWVGFSVIEFFGFFDFGGLLVVFVGGGGERVEEEGYGVVEDVFDFGDFVIGVDKVVEGWDDGEIGIDGGFVVDFGVRLFGSVEDFLLKFVGVREGFFVGSDDVDVIVKEEWVGVGDVLGIGVVDEDGFGVGGFEVFD